MILKVDKRDKGHIKPFEIHFMYDQNWPCYCTVHACVVIPFWGSMWSFQVEANLCRFVVICLFLYCLIKISNYQKGRVWIPLTGLKLPHFCVCPKPGPGFQRSNVMVFFFYFQCLVVRGNCSFCWYWWNCRHHCL